MKEKRLKILFLANWQKKLKNVGSDYAFFKHFRNKPRLTFLGTFDIPLWTRFEKNVLRFYILQPLWAFFLSFKFDLVIGYSSQSALPLAFLYRLFGRRTPLIVFDVETFGRPTGKIKLSIVKYGAKAISHVVYASTGQRYFYKNHIRHILNRSTHIPIGIGEYKKKLDFEQGRDSTNIIAIGKHGKAFRDWNTLMEGFAPFSDNIRLIIVGRETINSDDLEGAKIPSNVEFYPYMPIDELGDLVEKSRFAILPLPERNQSLGQLSILFLMAMGKAVITSRVIGVADYLDQDKTGLFYSPGNADEMSLAIRKLLDNPDMAVRMGKEGHRAVREKFNAEIMGKKWEECIALVMESLKGKGK